MKMKTLVAVIAEWSCQMSKHKNNDANLEAHTLILVHSFQVR